MNLVLPIGAAWVTFLAVADGSDIPLVGMVKEFGSFGLMMFFLWFVVSKWMPEQRKDYIAMAESQRADFTKLVDKMHADYIVQQSENRTEQRRLSDAVNNLANQINHAN